MARKRGVVNFHVWGYCKRSAIPVASLPTVWVWRPELCAIKRCLMDNLARPTTKMSAGCNSTSAPRYGAATPFPRRSRPPEFSARGAQSWVPLHGTNREVHGSDPL